VGQEISPKLPLSVVGSDPIPNTWFFGPPYVPHIILIGSAILTELIVVANRQTVRHNIGNNWQQLMLHIEIWPETYKDDDRPITFPMKTQIFPSSARN